MFGQKVCDGPRLGHLDGWLVIFFDWTPSEGSRRNLGWKFWNGLQLGESEGFLVVKRESEALGKTDGDVVGRFKRGCHLVKQTVPGLVNVWNER